MSIKKNLLWYVIISILKNLFKISSHILKSDTNSHFFAKFQNYYQIKDLLEITFQKCIEIEENNNEDEIIRKILTKKYLLDLILLYVSKSDKNIKKILGNLQVNIQSILL